MDESNAATKTGAVEPLNWTVKLVAAYVSRNAIPASQLPSMISATHAAVERLVGGAETRSTPLDMPSPAQIQGSITPAALVSFEDGKHYKTLKRHLACLTLTPEAYRRKWGLPEDYPMTAPDYSARRSALAKSLGLGVSHRTRKLRNGQAVPLPDVPRQSLSTRTNIVPDEPKTLGSS